MTPPRRVLVALAATAVLFLSACAPDSDNGLGLPGEADVDVDTKELRELKKAAGIEPCRPTDGDPVDDGLPDVTLPCLGGGPDVNLAGLRGPVVVNFWAAWCKPCRREMPIFQEFFEKHGDEVGVIGVDYIDPQPQAALELARESGVTYPLLADPGDELGAEGLPMRGLPVTGFLDADGRLVVVKDDSRLLFYEFKSLSELEELVEAQLGVTL